MEHHDDYISLLNICKARRSTREFDNQPVPAEIIDKIKKVVHTSPYASGKKNWEINAVVDRDILGRMAQAVENKISKLKDTIRPDMQEYFRSYSGNFTFFASAPAVLVLTFRSAPSLSLMLPDAGQAILQWERDNFVKSISCAAMLALLAAESLGLGSCYVTGALIAEEEIKELINIPDGRSIAALIPIGYKREVGLEH